MPLPERMKPTKISRQKLKKLADGAEEILSQIDNGTDEDDAELKALIETGTGRPLIRMNSLISVTFPHGPTQRTLPGWLLIRRNTLRI